VIEGAVDFPSVCGEAGELLGKSPRVAAMENMGVQKAATTVGQLLRNIQGLKVLKSGLYDFLQMYQPLPERWRGWAPFQIERLQTSTPLQLQVRGFM
jgi:hypothetical protein